MKKFFIFGLIALGFAACKPNIEPQKPGHGEVDVSQYLAVGNSLTAGYMDGSLYREGQENSFPALLNMQFALTLDYRNAFKQPLLNGHNGYPAPKFVLQVRQGYCDNNYTLKTIPFPGALDSADASLNIADNGPYNNFGIPGIRCVDFLTVGYGAQNPYARRFFSTPAAVRPIDEAMKTQPTFFTLWVGSNDVLGYATNGGEGSPIPISDIVEFTIAYDSIITNLTKYNAKGVVMNIPAILSAPFFTTIPPKGLTLTKYSADTLNDRYNGTGMRFHEGGSYFVIEDTSEAIKMRQIKEGELVLLSLPMDSVRCAGWGTSRPIPARFILTKNEIDKIKNALTLFNNVIAEKAAEHSLPLADMYSFMQTLEGGIKFNGVNNSTTYVSGNAISLDGIHPTPRGYALIANKIITVINEQYGATIPLIDVNNYRGILFP